MTTKERKKIGRVLKIKERNDSTYHGDDITNIKPIMMFNAKKFYDVAKEAIEIVKDKDMGKFSSFVDSQDWLEHRRAKEYFSMALLILVEHPGDIAVLDLFDTVSLGCARDDKLDLAVVLSKEE